jgi:hypothetical protein
MDNPFTKDTYPNLFEKSNIPNVYQYGIKASSLVPSKDSFPSRDARYPAYAAPMEDGRFMTDYRPQCSKNITTGQQFYTKKWMIHHGEELIEESRRRHMDGTGASLPMANTVPPPATRVYSTPFSSDVLKTNLRNGIGVERVNGRAPDLFGTFSYDATIREMQSNRKNVQLTTQPEGGRNSIRGVFNE